MALLDQIDLDIAKAESAAQDAVEMIQFSDHGRPDTATVKTVEKLARAIKDLALAVSKLKHKIDPQI